MKIAAAPKFAAQQALEAPAPAPQQTKPDSATRVGSSLPKVPAKTLSNFNGLSEWTPKYAFRPKSIDDLVNIMRFVQTLPKDVKVKAGGSRHSHTAAMTDGVYIHPEGLSFVQPLGDGMFRIGSGTKVSAINAALWKEGFSLPMLGGYDGQTLGGVLPTGTHGSGLVTGPLFTQVRSIDLVTIDGRKVRLEKGDPDFDDALVNLGAFGVVHSYEIEAVPKYHLREVRTPSSVKEVQAVLADGNIYHRIEATDVPAWVPPDDGRAFGGQPKQPLSMQVAFNPYTGKATITGREKIKMDVEPHDMSGRPARDLCLAYHLDPKYTRPVATNLIQELFHDVIGAVSTIASKIYPKAATKLTDGALDALVDGEYIGRSYNVFHLGDGSAQIPARFGTFFVPLRGDKYLRAMDVFSETAKAFAAKNNQYQTGPISLRFVKGNEASLSFQEDVGAFEVLFSGEPAHFNALMSAYRKALQKEFGDDVYYHFGQSLSDLSAADIAKSYPRLEEWKRVRRSYDPDGRFLNNHQVALGLV